MTDPNPTGPNTTDPNPSHPATRSLPGGSAGRRVGFRLEALPLRLRLIALLVLLLLVALTLTSIATSAMMRRQLMDSTDRDLRAAAVPTASQVLTQLLSRRGGGFPTNYAVRFMPTDGSHSFEVNPTGAMLHPDIPTLPLRDARAEHGTLSTVQTNAVESTGRIMPSNHGDGPAT